MELQDVERLRDECEYVFAQDYQQTVEYLGGVSLLVRDVAAIVGGEMSEERLGLVYALSASSQLASHCSRVCFDYRFGTAYDVRERFLEGYMCGREAWQSLQAMDLAKIWGGDPGYYALLSLWSYLLAFPTEQLRAQDLRRVVGCLYAAKRRNKAAEPKGQRTKRAAKVGGNHRAMKTMLLAKLRALVFG
ncbi:unnamed protein product [Amoebophrya sp. A25]|nr:unnamed protein product [Amoebophrya sp. A25]|eukprot:GSA25T00023385001.1